MTPSSADFAIEIKDLKKAFKNTKAVDGLDLNVKKGELFGILGPDGAGKTTTFRLLCGALIPNGGCARVAGYDVLLQPEEMKSKIGYMSQRFSLYEDLTVEENLDFFAAIHQVPKREKESKQKELLEFSRLTPFRNRMAGKLSGGMKQKLALACTLIHTPEILFLDEPTTGVDPLSRRDFWKILGQLVGRVTIVVSTPYMDEAERCHRLGFMYEGRLLDCDRPENIKSRFGGGKLEDAFISLIEREERK